MENGERYTKRASGLAAFQFLVISFSISSAAIGEIKKLLQGGVFKCSKADISTFGVQHAWTFPISSKTLLNISAVI